MASVADSFEFFLNDRFQALAVILKPLESGFCRTVKDFESRIVDSRNAFKGFEFKKKQCDGVRSMVILDGERNLCREKGFGELEMSVGRMSLDKSEDCSDCLKFAFSWPILADKLPFVKWIGKGFHNDETSSSMFWPKELNHEISSEKAKVRTSKKVEVFWLERDIRLALKPLFQSVKEFDNHRKRLDQEQVKPSHFGILKRSKEFISGKKEEIDGMKQSLELISSRKEGIDGFLSNKILAKVGLQSGFARGRNSLNEGEVCPSTFGDVEQKSELGQPNILNAMISMPLSNVQKLKSALSNSSVGELIEVVPQPGQVGRISKDRPDKKKLLSVNEFFRYTEAEGRRFFEELDRDKDGQVTLEDLETAMTKRSLPKRYARDFFCRTRRHFFSKSICWKQFLFLMEQREPTILRAYMTLCLSKSGTLQRSQILASLRSAKHLTSEDNVVAMMRYLNSDIGSMSYGRFRNFMILLPMEKLQDDPW